MSSTEPPAGSTPPPGEPAPPPPPAPDTSAAPPPPTNPGTYPPPPAAPPPPAGAAAPAPGAPAAQYGPGFPGNLLDRFLARLIDGIILAVVFGIISAIFSSIIYSGTHSLGEIFLFYLITGVIETALALGYFGYMESSRGQTIGKMAMKLQTFGPDHQSHPTMEQAIRRNIYYAFPLIAIIPVVGWFLYPLAALAALILILVGINSDPQRQHWFDKFAGGTQVLKVG
ncbi:MAG TPA: RDD family protein [Nocardioides sp.]|uniref:RDD family protein n=1 Tax=Nocardioides sp. TaxID=35761 RepID=UPI002E35B5E2|nr:RDD family protein [Nocardioides sp.]HEX5088004.1 RDD family protein [Nocardioides sp.]